MKSLLRWLAVGSRGYMTTYQPHTSTSTIITYEDHGYADDVNIIAGHIQDLKIQLRKLHFVSQHTGLQLETSKCAATESLSVHGNPLNQQN